MWRSDSSILRFSPAMFGISAVGLEKPHSLFSRGWELAKRAKLKITKVRNKIIGRNIQVKPRALLVRAKGLYRLY